MLHHPIRLTHRGLRGSQSGLRSPEFGFADPGIFPLRCIDRGASEAGGGRCHPYAPVRRSAQLRAERTRARACGVTRRDCCGLRGPFALANVVTHNYPTTERTVRRRRRWSSQPVAQPRLPSRGRYPVCELATAASLAGPSTQSSGPCLPLRHASMTCVRTVILLPHVAMLRALSAP